MVIVCIGRIHMQVDNVFMSGGMPDFRLKVMEMEERRVGNFLVVLIF